MGNSSTAVRVLCSCSLPDDATRLATAIVSDLKLPPTVKQDLKRAMVKLLEATGNCPGIRAIASAAPDKNQLAFYVLYDGKLVDRTVGPANYLEDSFTRVVKAAGEKAAVQGFFSNIASLPLIQAMEQLASECQVDAVRLGVVSAN